MFNSQHGHGPDAQLSGARAASHPFIDRDAVMEQTATPGRQRTHFGSQIIMAPFPDDSLSYFIQDTR